MHQHAPNIFLLYQHRVIAEADLEQTAESTVNQAQADLQAAEQALKVVGIEHPDRMSKDTDHAGGSGAGPHRGRGRGKAGFARAGDPGRRNAGLYHFQHGQRVGSRQCLRARHGRRAYG